MNQRHRWQIDDGARGACHRGRSMTRGRKQSLPLASAVSCAWAVSVLLVHAPARADSLSVEVDATASFNNCCGYYPLVPALVNGWREVGPGGFFYFGNSLNSFLAIAGGASGGYGRSTTTILAGVLTPATAGKPDAGDAVIVALPLVFSCLFFGQAWALRRRRVAPASSASRTARDSFATGALR